MTMRAQLIAADGTTTDVQPANGKDFSLAELQKFVGGYVELVSLSGGRTMAVNEDGWSLELPINDAASALYGGSHIVGDVLVCDRRMVK